MPEVLAYATDDHNAEFHRTTITRREPGPHDVAFDIAFAGICHSDIHTVKGEWGKPRYPVVPGHEIAGVVTAVGSQVTKFAVGDRVGGRTAAGPQARVDPRTERIGCQQQGRPQAVPAVVLLEAGGAEAGVIEGHQAQGDGRPQQPQGALIGVRTIVVGPAALLKGEKLVEAGLGVGVGTEGIGIGDAPLLP